MLYNRIYIYIYIYIYINNIITITKSICELAMKFFLKNTNIKFKDIIVNDKSNNTLVTSENENSKFFNRYYLVFRVFNRCSNGIYIDYKYTLNTIQNVIIHANTKEGYISRTVENKDVDYIGISIQSGYVPLYCKTYR